MLNFNKNLCFSLNQRCFHNSNLLNNNKNLASNSELDLDVPIHQLISDKNTNKRNSLFTCGLTKTGALGNKNFLGPINPSRENIWKPFLVRYFNGMNVSNVAAGYGFTIVAAKDSKSQHLLYGMGLNTSFQIGLHKDPKNDNILHQLILPCPIEVPLKKSTKIKDLACGRAHSIILTDDKILSLGNNSFGQCGVERISNEKENSGKKIINFVNGIDEKVENVVCGQDHTIFRTECGKLYSCGWSADGQTGLGHYKHQEIPKRIKGDIDGEKIVAVSTSADAVLALNDKGEVFGWGNSEYSQFKKITNQMQLNVPRKLKFNEVNNKIVDVACGGTMCALLDGLVYVWGYGILGKGPKIDHLKVPTILPKPLFGYNELNQDIQVKKINAGLSHFAAITNKGDLYMWGKNREGCLGLNQKQDQFFPLKVPVVAVVRKVSLGVDHTCVLGTTLI